MGGGRDRIRQESKMVKKYRSIMERKRRKDGCREENAGKKKERWEVIIAYKLIVMDTSLQ